MKKEYTKPVIEIYEIEVEDIITASGVNKTLNPFGLDLDKNKVDNWYDDPE